MKADLHNHTTYSDGVYSVGEVVERAKSYNLDIVGLTDHDNLDSYEECKRLNIDGINVINGVELSTWYMDEEVHILGYFYNNSNPGRELITYLIDRRNSRIEASKKMIKNLKEYYDIDIDYEEICKMTTGLLSRAHLARYIASHYNMDVNEAFRKYLKPGCKAYVPSSKISSKEAIDMLHRNNAIAIWAHPVLNKDKFREQDIIDMGIDGLEGNYPNNSEEDTIRYRELCNKYNLLFTGGSDFHDDESHSDIGTCYIEDEDINMLLEKLDIKFQ